MILIAAHLIQAVLDAEYVACSDARRSRHVQVIRLLAKGNGISQVSVITAYGERWIEQLRARYNAGGAETLGDLRRGNGTTATILTEAILAKLRERLKTPPPRRRRRCGRCYYGGGQPALRLVQEARSLCGHSRSPITSSSTWSRLRCGMPPRPVGSSAGGRNTGNSNS